MSKPVKVSERKRQALAMKVNCGMLSRKIDGFHSILGHSRHIVVYALSPTMAGASSEWTRDEYEGSLFIGERKRTEGDANQAGFFLFVYNRKIMTDLTDFLVQGMPVERHDHMVMYRNNVGVTRALWFYDKDDVNPIADLLEAIARGDPVADFASPEMDDGNGDDEGMTSPPDVVSTPAMPDARAMSAANGSAKKKPAPPAAAASAAGKKKQGDGSLLRFFPHLNPPESGIVGSPVPAGVLDPAVIESGEPLPPSAALTRRRPLPPSAPTARREPAARNEPAGHSAPPGGSAPTAPPQAPAAHEGEAALREAARREAARREAHARAAADAQMRYMHSVHMGYPMQASAGMPGGIPPPQMHPGMHPGPFVNPEAAAAAQQQQQTAHMAAAMHALKQGHAHGQQGMNQPPHGHPAHGHPQHGRPQHGHPMHAPPQHGHPAHGQPMQGRPQHGHPQHGQPMQGRPQHGRPQHGQPVHGQPAMGGGHPMHAGQAAHMGPPQQKGHQAPMARGPVPFPMHMPHPSAMGFMPHHPGGPMPPFFPAHMGGYSPPGSAGFMGQGGQGPSNPDSPRMPMHPQAAHGPAFHMHGGNAPHGWGNRGQASRDMAEESQNAILGFINGTHASGKHAGNGHGGRPAGGQMGEAVAADGAEMIAQGMAQLDVHGDVGGKELSVNDFRSVIQRMLSDQRLFGQAYKAYKTVWAEQKELKAKEVGGGKEGGNEA